MLGVMLLLVTLGMAFTGQVLRFDQDAYWGLGIGASIVSRVPFAGPWLVNLLLGGPIIAGATLSRFFAMHVFLIPGLLIGVRVPARAVGVETGSQRMAGARSHRSARHLPAGIPPADPHERRALRSVRGVEGHSVLRLRSALHCRLRRLLWSLRSEWTAGSDDYSDSTASGFLLLVDLRRTGFPATGSRNAVTLDCSRRRDCPVAVVALLCRGRREELEAQADRRFHRPAGRGDTRQLHAVRTAYALEPGDGRVEQHANPSRVSPRAYRAGAERRHRVPGEAVPQLPFARRPGRQARTGARPGGASPHQGSARATSDPGRRQYARLREEPEPCGGNRRRWRSLHTLHPEGQAPARDAALDFALGADQARTPSR